MILILQTVTIATFSMGHVAYCAVFEEISVFQKFLSDSSPQTSYEYFRK